MIIAELGDFNINLLSEQNISIEYQNLTSSHGFFLLNQISRDAPTRVATRTVNNQTITTSTIIDHAITCIQHFSYDLSTSDVSYSDHKLMLLSFNDRTNQQINFIHEPAIIFVKKLNEQKFATELNASDLSNVETFSEFITMMNTIKDRCTKMGRKQIITNPFKPWFNLELKDSITERNRYFKLLKKSSQNAYLKSQYECFTERVINLKNTLRNRYNSGCINNNIKNPKLMWQTINEILSNNKKATNNIQAIRTHENVITFEPKVITNTLNTFFREIGKNLHDNIPQIRHYQFNTTTCRQNTLVLFPTDEHEIASKIYLMKMSNNPNDPITSKILKQNINFLAPIIAKLIKNCFLNGTFPMELKIARILPLYKEDDPLLASNYRPISILRSLSKVFDVELNPSLCRT